MRHAGRRALVTGASRGLGQLIAAKLAADGAEVVLVARHLERLTEAAERIRKDGGSVEVSVCDLGHADEVDELALRTGPVDILVNNAAGNEVEVPFPVVQREDARWRAAFEVGFFAPLALIRALAPGMAARGSGSIVNVSSIAGAAPSPYLGTYATSKAALNQLTRVVAMELAGSGVRCNAVAPGITDAGKTWDMIPRHVTDNIGRIVPTGELVHAADIASIVSWLCSEEATPITGQVVTADGGMTAGLWATSMISAGI